jgi:hypothetical protein
MKKISTFNESADNILAFLQLMAFDGYSAH